MSHDFSSHNIVFDPPFFTVCEKDTWYAIVPKSRCHGGAALIMDSCGDVLLAEIYRYPINMTVLEIPRGGGDADLDKSPLDTAVREAREELGVDLSDARIIDLGIIHPDNGILSYENQICAAILPVPFGAVDIDTEELTGHKIVPFDALRAMVLKGEINDSHTIAATMRLDAILSEERRA